MAPLVGVLSAKGEKRGVLRAITRAPIAFLLSFLEFDCVGNLHLFFSLSLSFFLLLFCRPSFACRERRKETVVEFSPLIIQPVRNREDKRVRGDKPSLSTAHFNRGLCKIIGPQSSRHTHVP